MSNNHSAVLDAFMAQAEVCRPMGSPFTADLCLKFAKNLDHSTKVGSFCLEWSGDPGPSADSIPLRLCGGLHAIVLSNMDDALAQYYPSNGGDGPSWEIIQKTLVTHAAFLLNWMQSPPQTNEVSRSGVIWRAFMEVARLTGMPLHLLEVGASGGLNLQASRFAYSLGDASCGDLQSKLHLVPDWKGKPPVATVVDVVAREACDLNPLDPTNEEDALRLRAYVWPDQKDRHQRLESAIELAQEFPAPVDRIDAIDWLRLKLSGLEAGVCTTIYSTIAWQYLPQSARDIGNKLILDAAESLADGLALAWVRFEADGKTPGAAIRAQLWNVDRHKHIDCVLGRADFHGRWIDWRGV